MGVGVELPTAKMLSAGELARDQRRRLDSGSTLTILGQLDAASRTWALVGFSVTYGATRNSPSVVDDDRLQADRHPVAVGHQGHLGVAAQLAADRQGVRRAAGRAVGVGVADLAVRDR